MRIRRLLQMRDGVLRHHEGAARVDRLHQVVALHVGLGDRRARDGAGVVDHDVEAAERRDRLLDGGLDRVLVAHIDDERQRPAAGLLDLLGGGVDRAFELGMRRLGLGGDGDVGAVARRPQRDREPDAARGAGDEQRLALERHRWVPCGPSECCAQLMSSACRGFRPQVASAPLASIYTLGSIDHRALQTGGLHRDVLGKEPRNGDARSRLLSASRIAASASSASMQPPAALPNSRR